MFLLENLGNNKAKIKWTDYTKLLAASVFGIIVGAGAYLVSTRDYRRCGLLLLMPSVSHVLLAQTSDRNHLDGASELLSNRSKCSREGEKFNITDCFHCESEVFKWKL